MLLGKQTAAFRHKTFYRTLEGILRQIDEEEGLESMLTAIFIRVADELFGVEGSLRSARLYRRDDDEFVIVKSFGEKGKSLLGKRVPASYPVFSELDTGSVAYFFPDDEQYDPSIEERLGVGAFAAFYLGRERHYAAAFGIEDGADVDEVMLTLNALRYGISHRLKEISLEGQLREAREIQISLLPRKFPELTGFDMAGRSIPAEQVGGDILDVITLAEDMIGIAVGDASGHGLPAALQARDVVTGLRMAVEKDLKITAVMRRLNHVIHRSGLTSRFVSLFYGELEPDGNFVYANAGHEPGLLLRGDGSFEKLASTGIVMGPLVEAEYGRRMSQAHPGDMIVLYSDGVIEMHDPGQTEEYGMDRFQACLRNCQAEGIDADSVCDRVLESVREFGGGQAPADDITIMAIRRLEA